MQGDEFNPSVVSHEYGHAVDNAIKNILSEYDDMGLGSPAEDDTQGVYGDIGAQLAWRNRLAIEDAFPFVGEKEELPSGESLSIHKYSRSELRNAVREFRRAMGSDPKPSEVERVISSSDVAGDYRGTAIDNPRPSLGDITRHYEMTQEELEAFSNLTPEEEAWLIEQGDAIRTDFPRHPEHPPDYDPGYGLELTDPYREGTPSPEDIAKAMREFSHYRPMTGALSRAFG